jgi:hypothetical protein
MPASRNHVVAHFVWANEIIKADSVEAAKALVHARYPRAHFGDWGQGVRCMSLAAWADTVTRLRYELGEREDSKKPVAYVVVSRLPLERARWGEPPQ